MNIIGPIGLGGPSDRVEDAVITRSIAPLLYLGMLYCHTVFNFKQSKSIFSVSRSTASEDRDFALHYS